MKTRFGYVSNSSSSSFVIYGDGLKDAAAVKEAVANGKIVYCVDENGGWSGECADFAFRLTPERLEKIGAHLDDCMRNKRFSAVQVEWASDSDEIQFALAHRTGKCLFKFRKDERSPATDAVDDEEFVRWIEKSAWRFNRDPDDRPLKIGRRITLDEARKRLDEKKSVVFMMDDCWAMYTLKTDRKDVFDRLVAACPKWIEDETCFFLDELNEFRSGGRIDLDGTYICASAGWISRMPNVKWMENVAEKYQYEDENENVLPEE